MSHKTKEYMAKVGKYLKKASDEIDNQTKDLKFVVRGDEAKYRQAVAAQKKQYINDVRVLNTSLKQQMTGLNKELSIAQKRLKEMERELENNK